MRRTTFWLVLWLGAATACAVPTAAAAKSAKARHHGAHAPADGNRFDYYVLSLSWSPEHCSTHHTPGDDPQCGIGHHYGFIVHGLWPQYENGGYPSTCSTQKVPESVVIGMLDLMPSRTLVTHEWQKHGTCSGLEPAEYFQQARSAFGRLSVPDRYRQPETALHVTVDELHDDFASANPTVPAKGLAMVCDSGQLAEVRACLTKDLLPRPCGAKVADTCHGTVAVRPVRHEPPAPEPEPEPEKPVAGGAEYAMRWQSGTGGPKSPTAVLHVLGREPEDTDEYEVRYFDFTAPADAPAGFAAILRDRRKDAKHAVTFKYRGDHALSTFTCPLASSADTESEVDVTVKKKGERRSYSTSCALENPSGPVTIPDGLHAEPKACASAMTRVKSGKLKVEEWRLPNGTRMLEVSSKGADSKKALAKFRKEVATPLLKAGVKPSDESKTDLGSHCP